MKISKRKLKKILPVIIGGTILSTSLVYAADHTNTQTANSGETVVLGDGDTITITNGNNAIKVDGGEMSGKDIQITAESNRSSGSGIRVINGGKLTLTGTNNKLDFVSTGQINSAIRVESGSTMNIDGMTGTYNETSSQGGFFLLYVIGGSEAEISNSDFTVENGMFATISGSSKVILKNTNITASNDAIDMPTHVFQIGRDGELVADGITVTSDIQTDSGYIIANGYLATISNSTLTSTKGNGLIATSEDGGKFIGDNLTLNFNRNGAGNLYAISASGESLTSLKDSTLNVTGDALLGIFVYDKGTLKLDNTKVDVASMYNATTGSRGIQLQTNGSILEMTNGTEVTATGFGLYSTGAGTIASGDHHTVLIDNSKVTSTRSWGSQIQNGEAQVTLTGANASLQGADGFGALNVGGTTVETLVNVAVTDSATLNGNVRAIGAGQAATLNIDLSNNGKLIGDAITTGTDSSLNLKMDSGAVWTGGTTGDAVSADISNSQWNMTKDSAVKTLAMGTGGVVAFGTDTTGNVYGNLTVEDLSGTDGNFIMRTDLVGDGAGNNTGDFLHVTGTSAGEHTVTVQNNGAANATGNETLTIIRTEDGVAQFTNSNVVELGGYEYNLRDVAGTNQQEWELYGTKGVEKDKEASKPGSAAVNLFAGSYLLNYAETQTLMKRMGDLREGKENGNVWGRIYGGKFHSDSDSFLKDFDLKYVGVQVGADKKFVREDGKGVVYLGGFFGYTKGDIDYGYGSGDVDSKSLGAYWTHMHHNGFYADAVLKYGWIKNDFDVLDSQGAKVTGDDISTHGFTGSLEVGRRYHFDQKDKDGWYIEPQAQVTISHQNGDGFTASNGLNIKVDSFRSVMGRVGTHLGYEVKGGKNPINIYGKVSVVKEFDGDVNYSFNGSPETTSYKDTWVVYGVGATAKLGARHNLYLDVERATGGQFTQSWAVNGGYRYSW